MKKLYDYEKQLSAEKKKKEGITYTPIEIVDYINTKCLSNWDKDIPPKVIDFSCGTGVFLVDMAEKISKRYKIPIDEVYKDFIYGNDLDTDALQIFAEQTGCLNTTSIDGLFIDLSVYDIIVGNPPYVKIQNLEEHQRLEVQKLDWCSVGNIDLYIAFSERKAKSNKIYGMICPNSWIKTASGSKMRTFLLDNNMQELIDFRGKMNFKESTYTSIVISSGKKQDSFVFKTSMEDPGEITVFDQVDHGDFFLKKEERSFVQSISEKDNLFLDYFDMSVGIATLYDKGYYLPRATVGNDFVKFGSHKIELGVVKKAFKASKLDLYDKGQEDYFIYPYKNGRIIEDQEMRSVYPLAYKYLQTSKSKFLKRDKGGFKKRFDKGEVEWYEYGRTQALSIQDEKVLIAPVFKKIKYKKIDQGIFFSGYCIFPKTKKFGFNKLLEILSSDDFQRWVELNGSHKRGGFFSLNKKTVSNFRF